MGTYSRAVGSLDFTDEEDPHADLSPRAERVVRGLLQWLSGFP